MPNTSLGTRKSVTVMLSLIFCYLSITGKIGSTEFMTVFTVVIGFYFGGSTALDNPASKMKEEHSDDETTQL